MKHLIILILLATTIDVFAQPETFDIVTFTAPDAWEKKIAKEGVQLSKEDTATGAYCVITLFKSAPATANAKENFELAWISLVKDMIRVAELPAMELLATEDGREVVTGHANFERDGIKGVAILVNSSGFGNMVNIIILTNTEIYEQPIGAFLESIEIKKTGEVAPGPVSKPATADGYTFNTSNFDDGWTSTVQEDWAQVSKGATLVLIHYPNKIVDEYNPDLLEGLKIAWNILVAPRYSEVEGLEFKTVSDWQPVEWAAADAVDKASGKRVYVVLFKKNYSGGGGRYIEFIMADKNAFVTEFGEYGSDWDKLGAMANYNKFAVAATDLIGKWTSNFSGSLHYVNANTGMYAGMNSHASNEKFSFSTGNNYTWDLGVASGMVGSIKFQKAKAAGKFSMVGNWQINLSDIEGTPRTYDVSFECRKGLRVLWMNGSAYVREE